MIEIEILNSPDQKRCGIYLIHKNSITLGNHTHDDILLQSSDITENHLSLKIQEFKLYLNINPEIDFVLVNGKRTTGSKLLKPKDIIKIQNIEIKILSFIIENTIKRKDFLNKRVEELKDENSLLIPILQKANEIL